MASWWTLQKPTKAWKLISYFEKRLLVFCKPKGYNSRGIRKSFPCSVTQNHPIHSWVLSLTQEHMQPCGSSSHVGLQQTVWAPKTKLNMKQTLDTGLCLALLKTQLDFFHGVLEQDGKLESQGQPSQLNFAIAQLPGHGFLECYPHIPWKNLTSTGNTCIILTCVLLVQEIGGGGKCRSKEEN